MKYAFEAKQTEYRSPVWTTIERLSPVARWKRRVAILDTAEGLETQHLLRLGYRPENILAVNRSAAQVAAMTLLLRRSGLPDVNTVAGDYAIAVAKHCSRAGWSSIDVLSFDSTSNLMGGGFYKLGVLTKLLRPTVVSSVCLGGRESRSMYQVLAAGIDDRRDSRNRVPSGAHAVRAEMMARFASGYQRKNTSQLVCVAHVQKFRWSTYRSSSGQQMVWSVARMVPHNEDPLGLRADLTPLCLSQLAEMEATA